GDSKETLPVMLGQPQEERNHKSGTEGLAYEQGCNCVIQATWLRGPHDYDAVTVAAPFRDLKRKWKHSCAILRLICNKLSQHRRKRLVLFKFRDFALQPPEFFL